MGVLEVKNIIKKHADREVLRGVSLSLAKGQRTALLGPSGCGKTTLLNCISGLDRPDAGEVWLGSRQITALSAEALSVARRSDLGTVFQFFHLLPTMTAEENVELPLKLLRIPGAERRQRVRKLMERVVLKHRANALPGEMSGGEMQRVAIARAVVHGPALILADEPTGNLDSATGVQVLELLREITDESGAAMLMVTHSEEAARVCHDVLRMKDGLLADG
jgi:ABC-type lipoprotein export system ATPase subunit